MAGIGTFGLGFGVSGVSPNARVPRTASGNLPVGRYYTTIGGERLDQVALRAYGIQSGAVEALLLVNPGLADKPYHLPSGLAIELPELKRASTTKQSREVNLWG